MRNPAKHSRHSAGLLKGLHPIIKGEMEIDSPYQRMELSFKQAQSLFEK